MPGAEGLWLAVVVRALEDLHRHRLSIGSLRGRLSICSAQQWFQSLEGGIGSLEPERVRALALGAVAPIPPTTPRDTSPLGNSLSVRDAVGVPREGKFDFP